MFLGDISEPNTEHVSLMFKGVSEVRVRTGNCYDNVVVADVIVLTEILEHLEDPDRLLSLAREHGKYLVASSPIDEVYKGNDEHVWGWTQQQYKEMLEGSGWTPIAYQELKFFPKAYDFQLWICK